MESGLSEHAAPIVTILTAHEGAGPDASWASLSRAIARGDDRAFEAFYRQWFERAVKMVCVMTRRDEAFGLDVVQAAMLKAARRMPAMQTDREVEAWMTRVLRTTALDELRREKRRALREGRAGAPGARKIEEANAELIGALRRELDGVSSSERDLVRRRFAHGETHAQAGDDAGLTGDAAHGRLRRVLARLRAALGGDES